jgi:hypothetical protein
MAHGDPTNIDRAERAARMVMYYQNKVRTDLERDLAVIMEDVLADMMHLARYEKVDWDRVVKMGTRHFEEEVEERDDAGPRAWSPRGWRGLK